MFKSKSNPQKSRNASKVKLMEEIVKLWCSLIFIKPEEIEARIEKIKSLPEDGLKNLLKILEKAHEKQHEYFSILTDRDYMFPSQLKMMAYRGELGALVNEK